MVILTKHFINFQVIKSEYVPVSISLVINVFVFFALSEYENVAVRCHSTTIKYSYGYSSDMKVVAAFRPRCCGRAGEPMPNAAMNLLRKIWVSLSNETTQFFILL